MKHLITAILGLICITATAQPTLNPPQPNFLIYMVEDMGWQDTAVPFWSDKTAQNRTFNTPTMVAIASDGIRFRRAYTSSFDPQVALLNASTGLFEWSRTTQPTPASVGELLSKNGYIVGQSLKPFSQESITPQAREIIDQSARDSKPFFLAITHQACDPKTGVDARFYANYIKAGLSPEAARYASYVENADRSLGDIEAYLDTKKLLDNTIIVFVSHGGSSYGEPQNPLSAGGGSSSYAPVRSPSRLSNYPLNARIGSVYEGGVRVQLMVRSPYNTQAGTCDTPVSMVDFMPTIIDMAGLKSTKLPQRLDGLSLVPLLVNNGVQPSGFRRDLFWFFDPKSSQVGSGYGGTCTILRGDWKLIYYFETGKSELFNLRDDIFEIVNQIDNSAAFELRDRMARDLTTQMKRIGYTFPTPAKGTSWRYPDGKIYKK